jgi:hypothetical protein
MCFDECIAINNLKLEVDSLGVEGLNFDKNIKAKPINLSFTQCATSTN